MTNDVRQEPPRIRHERFPDPAIPWNRPTRSVREQATASSATHVVPVHNPAPRVRSTSHLPQPLRSKFVGLDPPWRKERICVLQIQRNEENGTSGRWAPERSEFTRKQVTCDGSQGASHDWSERSSPSDFQGFTTAFSR